MAHDDLEFTTGDVSGTVVQANNIHGDVHVHPGKMPRPAYDSPGSWTEVPQPTPEIQSLLWAQIHAAHETSYRLRDARKPSLDTVYVRQDLGNAVEEPEQPRQGPVLDDDGKLIETATRPVVRFTVRPPSRTMTEALDGDAHLIVTGGPGLGKSTLTRRLAAEIARHWTKRDDAPLSEPVVPLRITAHTLAARLDVPFIQALADSAAAEYGSLLREPLEKDLFTGRAMGCRWLLLVDGLDEVADNDQRLRLVNALAAWTSDDTYRILLTTRPTEGGALTPLQRIGAVRYELQPFDGAALERFAANWFPADDAQRFLHQIREAHLDELVQVPLLATIAAIIFGEYGAQPLPGNQYSLYETYLAHIRRDKPDEFDRERLLEHLARIRLEEDPPLLAAAQRWVEERFAPNSLAWREELTAYLLAVGPFELRGDDLAFMHHSFAEHLAATSRARDLPDSFCPKAFGDLLHAADARESGRFARAVLLHHARLHPGEADRLLEWLHEGGAAQHLLAARLLAHHLPASAVRTEAFLITVWGWAMTTQYDAADILTDATRATHHPGLVGWLARLMHCTAAPWRSRAEAATALAVRVRGPHSSEAVGFLRSVVDEPKVPVSDRLVAAEALAQSGSAERDTAERGLRAVLTNPDALGSSIRAAAVVLAALGSDARTFAIDNLNRIRSDVDSGPLVVVEVTAGLLEIDPGFAEVCADSFRSLLRTPAKTSFGWYDAALGLASISPAHLDEAVAELTVRITDRRRSADDRIKAARALGELGPHQRQAAGELIVAEAAKAVRHLDRTVLLGHLVTYGPHREPALAGLRDLLAERHLNWNNVRRAAAALGQVGPAFHDEAARALRNSCPPPGSHDHVIILDELVDLGEPHRAEAVRELHDLLADPDVHFAVRCRAANTLIRCGPNHHPEVVTQLQRLVASHSHPEAAPRAYQELARTSMRDIALDFLLDRARSLDTAADASFLIATAVELQDSARVEEAAALLRAAARDRVQSLRIRITAANGLTTLSNRYDRESARELRRMIISEPMITDFVYIANCHSDSGSGPRAELAEALLEVLADERMSAGRVWKAIQALEELGHGDDQRVLSALESLVRFPGLARDSRAEAAVLLSSRRPAHLELAVALVVDAAENVLPESLRNFLPDLPPVLDSFRVRITGDGAKAMERITAAELLGDAAELRRLAREDALPFVLRQLAWQSLVSVAPSELGEASIHLWSVIDDADSSVGDRCWACWRLAQLDRTTTVSMIRALWRFADDQEIQPDERAEALRWLNSLLRPRTSRYDRAAAEILRDPDASRKAWSVLITKLARPVRTDLERTLLHDRTVPIEHRVPAPDDWDDRPLRDDVVAEIRDVAVAPETAPRHRVQAAVALFGVSGVHQAEAVEVLEQLRGRAEFAALTGLSAMGQARWWRVHDQALAEVTDTGLPFRVRYSAASLLVKIQAELGPVVTDVLCGAPSRTQRVDGYTAVGNLGALRRIRDDVEELPSARIGAARKLLVYTADDRAKGVLVIEEVAANRALRPALRLRAMRILRSFGEVGRRRAAVAARGMLVDVDLPVLPRAKAASIVADVQRSARREVLTILTELCLQADPLPRVRILRMIGDLDSARAVGQLQAMGVSEPSPVVRMWCARAMVEIRRDQREKAAMIARAVAWNEGVPRHVRCRAAGDLARWSELMREDARALLVRLRDCAAR